MTNTQSKKSEIRSVGRPRSLTLDMLLDAATEIGLNEVNMKKLSAHLGVGIATLYRYVSNREELIRLASSRHAYRKTPADDGQPWPDIVLGYAASLQSSIGKNPQFIYTHMEGGLGTELEIEFIDAFILAMSRRGFSGAEALRLFHTMGWIITGAGVASAHLNSMKANDETLGRSMRKALAIREPEELPSIRSVATEYADEQARTNWAYAVAHLIRSVAHQRGEPVPDIADILEKAAQF